MKSVLLICLLLVAQTVSAQTAFGPPVPVTATVTSTKVLDANSLRSYLIIQNTGSVSVIVKFNSVQSGTEGIVIPAGGNYEPILAPGGSVWLRSASSTAAVTLLQGNS